MAHGMHLGDEVEVVTDGFAPMGVPRGAIGVIVGDWADGTLDVDVSEPKFGEVVARIQVTENDVRLFTGAENAKGPRTPGLLFGRGDDLGAPPGDPPSPPGSQFGGMPGSASGPWYGAEPPPEEGTIAGEIPWELREEPPTGPIFH